MKLSIIIVNWNTCNLLATCLASLETGAAGLDYETLVVDNASTDGSPAMVRSRFPYVRVIENLENLGFSRANNQGIKLSEGEFILLLNSDAALFPGAAAILVNAVEERSHAGIAGARLVFPDGRPQPSFGPRPSLWTEIIMLSGLDKLIPPYSPMSSSAPFNTGVVSGACLLARRNALDAIGLLDEDFFMFNEETDLCFRAHQAGWQVIHVPAARCTHVGAGSTGTTPERMLRLYRSKVKFFEKYDGFQRANLLRVTVKVFTHLKIWVYSAAAPLSRTARKKRTLWRQVAQGLSNL